MRAGGCVKKGRTVATDGMNQWRVTAIAYKHHINFSPTHFTRSLPPIQDGSARPPTPTWGVEPPGDSVAHVDGGVDDSEGHGDGGHGLEDGPLSDQLVGGWVGG